MTLRLNGSTSGYTEIDAPAVAANNNLTLPTTTSGSLVALDSSGRLLVGTSTAQGSGKIQVEGDGDGAKLYLRRNITNSSMTTSGQVVLGSIDFGNIDGAVGARIQANNDTDSGWANNDYPSRLVFSTTADGASSPTERMRISSAGGIFANGATSPVAGNPNDGIHVGTLGTQLGGALTIGDSLATARWRIETGSFRLNFSQNDGSGTYNVRAYVNNSTGAYVQVSDQRAKKNIADSAYGIDDLKKLRAVSYLMGTQDEDTSRRNLGFIAQEVFEVIPEAVNKPEDEKQMYGLESIALIPVLVSSLQQAVAKIEQLEAKVAALESA